jgi:hypothetical protein
MFGSLIADRSYRVRSVDDMVLRVIGVDQPGQNVEFVAIRASATRTHQRLDAGDRRIMVLLSSNRIIDRCRAI